MGRPGKATAETADESTVVPLGRPRDPAIDDAVLTATRALLLEVGYPRLSFGLVARRAGVTRPTIYRRWPSKPHLVHDALYHAVDIDQSTAERGDFAADLRAQIHATLRSYARPEVRAAVPGLIADLHDHPELHASVIDRLEQPVRDRFAQLVRNAIDRGEVAPDIDPEAIFDLWSGALLHHVILRGQTNPAFADQIADVLIEGTSPS